MNDTTKRSGFIKVHWNKGPIWIHKDSIVGVWFSQQNQCTMIDNQSADDWQVDETPEQILKLIEEVEQ